MKFKDGLLGDIYLALVSLKFLQPTIPCPAQLARKLESHRMLDARNSLSICGFLGYVVHGGLQPLLPYETISLRTASFAPCCRGCIVIGRKSSQGCKVNVFRLSSPSVLETLLHSCCCMMCSKYIVTSSPLTMTPCPTWYAVAAFSVDESRTSRPVTNATIKQLKLAYLLWNTLSDRCGTIPWHPPHHHNSHTLRNISSK